MIKKHYKKSLHYIEHRRFLLLLIATILVLILPAFSGSGLVSELLFVVTMSFLFMQSMIAAKIKKSRKRLAHYTVLVMIIIAWLKPIGIDAHLLDLVKVILFVTFFFFVMRYLVRFIVSSPEVNQDVLITSINIYLLLGIIGAFLAFFFYNFYPDAYIFPAYIKKPAFVNFIYYSFITMSTVGYGDITPKIPETQTLAYFISVTGQLYVAIIIAFLVGKLLVSPEKK